MNCKVSIVASDKPDRCIKCLGDDHFVDLKNRVCKACMRLGDSTCRRRRLDWTKGQAQRFQSMVEEQEGGESSKAGSLAQSQSSQSQSRGRSVN